MTCPSELQLMMFADGECESEELVSLQEHLGSCSSCSLRVTALQGESRLLADLCRLPSRSAEPSRISSSPVWLAAAAALLMVFVGPAPSLVPASALATISNLALDTGISVFLALLQQGQTTMQTLFLATCVLLLGALFSTRVLRRLGLRSLGLLALLAVLQPGMASAADDDADDDEDDDGTTIIDKDERREGTVVLSDDTVRVDGSIAGDLVVMGRLLEVRGNIEGNVIALVKTLEIEGNVAGAVHCFCKEASIEGTVAQNLYFFGESLDLGDTATIGRDGFFFGKQGEIRGNIGRDFDAKGQQVRTAATIGRDLSGDVGTAKIAAGTTIGRDLILEVSDESATDIDPSVQVGRNKEVKIDEDAGRSQWTRPGFYLGKAASFGALYLMGLLFLIAVPAVLKLDLPHRLGRTLGAGFLVLVAVPVLAVLLMLTIVGIPVAILLLLSYALAIYLAKPIAAAYIGRALLQQRGQGPGGLALSLLVGLLLLAILTQLPIVGGWATFLVVLLGLGSVYLQVSAAAKRRKGEQRPEPPLTESGSI